MVIRDAGTGVAVVAVIADGVGDVVGHFVVVATGNTRTVLDVVRIANGRSVVIGLVVVIKDAGTSIAVVIIFDNRSCGRGDIGGFVFIGRYVVVIATGSGGGVCVVVDNGVQFNRSFI